MTSLILFDDAAASLKDRLAAAAQARVLVDLVKAAQKRVDRQLADEVDRLSTETGTAFTARGDGALAGWSAQLTAPTPRAYVADEEDFAGWWVARGGDHQFVERIEHMPDAPAAVKALRELQRAAAAEETHADVAGLAEVLACSLRVRTDVLLPEDAVDQAVAGARAVDAGWVTEGGEVIPGLAWRQQAPQLRVAGTKDAKAAARRHVCELLGIDPAALEEGGRP